MSIEEEEEGDDRDAVCYVGPEAHPPPFAVLQAEAAAVESGCRVSRRGVSAYLGSRRVLVDRESVRPIPAGSGHNGPPRCWVDGAESIRPGDCDASEACQRDCGRRCIHAEVRAFLAVPESLRDRLRYARYLRLVHVKVGEDGRAIPSGGPRCMPCASFLLDCDVGGIWLLEEAGLWRYYRIEDFYDATARAVQLYVPGRGAGGVT